MEKILKNIEYGKGKMNDIDLLWDIQRKIEGNTICPLGDAAAWPVAAAIRHFRDEFEWHVLNPEECMKRNYGLAHYAIRWKCAVMIIALHRQYLHCYQYLRETINMAEEKKLFKVTIDNITIEVPAGNNCIKWLHENWW